MKTDTMELNRKTAMELWTKQFGKTNKAVDYAGRQILKAAYDDRCSAFGWNVDHIFPRSLGGKTAEHNLVCCHMETNSEKADKFPCFTANDTRFEIRKVQNHYEIVALGNAPVDFFDAKAGVSFWNKCCNSDPFWEGNVTISFSVLKSDVDNAFVGFVTKLFEDENFSLSEAQKMQRALVPCDIKPRRHLLLCIHKLNRKKDVQRVLDLCVLLNTYMGNFLYARGLINYYSLYFDINCYPSELEALCSHYGGKDFSGNGLYVSESVKNNTDLKDERLRSAGYSGGDYEYRCVYTNLSEELKKI